MHWLGFQQTQRITSVRNRTSSRPEVEQNLMTEPSPPRRFRQLSPRPLEGHPLVALFITVRKVVGARNSRDFYFPRPGRNRNPWRRKPVQPVSRLSNSWIIMKPLAGPPTPRQAGISVVDYEGLVTPPRSS